jgi:hypothetical protein
MRREVGLLVHDSAAVARLEAFFAKAHAESTSRKTPKR